MKISWLLQCYRLEKKYTFCNTQNPISIGKIVIERNLRPRRKQEFKEDTEIEKLKEPKPQINNEKLRMIQLFSDVIDQWNFPRRNKKKWQLQWYQKAKLHPDLFEVQEIIKLFENDMHNKN